MFHKLVIYFYQKLTLHWLIFPGIFFTYLLWNTGLHGDDYAEIARWQNSNLNDFFTASINDLGVFVFGLPIFYSLYWVFPFIGDEYQFVYDIIKILVHVASFTLTFIFFNDYLKRDRALLAAALFILIPLHDAANYWYMALSYILVPSILMFAHHRVSKNNFVSGFLLSFLGCFAFYASLPIVFGLGCIFLLQRKIKSFVIYISPGIIYSAFYLYMKFQIGVQEVKINSELKLFDYLRDVFFQFITMFEASIGPSALIKLFQSIGSISLFSIFILFFILTIFNYHLKLQPFSSRQKTNSFLLYGLVIIIISSFCIYALTGAYWHTPFNLSNRSLIYPSLLISYLIACFIKPKKLILMVFGSFMIASILGISDHWKSWNHHQKMVIEKINKNPVIQQSGNATFFVSQNLYSKMGHYSYIEFFSMPWNVRAIFSQDQDTNFIALTPYLKINENSALDLKSKNIYEIYDTKYLYESNSGKLSRVSNKEIEDLILISEPVHRHWIQFLKGTFVEDFIVKHVPGLAYLFV